MKEGEDFFERVGTQPRHPSNRAVPEEARTAPDVHTPQNLPSSTQGGASWASSGDVFWQVGKNYKELPPGVYRCDSSPNIGPCFWKVKNQTDHLIHFPDSESWRLLEEMNAFQGMREKFQKHGFLHKRGVLLYGPPGEGSPPRFST